MVTHQIRCNVIHLHQVLHQYETIKNKIYVYLESYILVLPIGNDTIE